METKIISQKNNPFLEREEFIMEILSDVTPTDAQIKEELGKDDNLTVIRKVTTKFGSHKVIADIIVYNNEEAKKKNQVLPQKLRKKLEAEQKAREEEERKAKAEAEKAVEVSSASTPTNAGAPQENIEREGKAEKAVEEEAVKAEEETTKKEKVENKAEEPTEENKEKATEKTVEGKEE